jgi:hypothetical protein
MRTTIRSIFAVVALIASLSIWSAFTIPCLEFAKHVAPGHIPSKILAVSISSFAVFLPIAMMGVGVKFSMKPDIDKFIFGFIPITLVLGVSTSALVPLPFRMWLPVVIVLLFLIARRLLASQTSIWQINIQK